MKINVDGRIESPERATISVLDHGFLFGDSVYEVVRTYGRRPFRLEEHLDRMERSAAGIALELPTRLHLAEELFRTGAEVPARELYLRLIVTRGVGKGLGLDLVDFGQPSVVIIAAPLVELEPSAYERGLTLALVRTRRNLREALDPALKTGNYLNNLLAMLEARRAGAHEGILLNAGGELTEGTRSNLFVVRGKAVLTPSLRSGLLAGVTRSEVIKLCLRAGLALAEASLAPRHLEDADEAFITSTTKGVVPVTRVGSRAIGAGTPGPITRQLLESFEALVAKFVLAPETRLDRTIPELADGPSRPRV
jgi:branched-chain amino acid aminotransferase